MIDHPAVLDILLHLCLATGNFIESRFRDFGCTRRSVWYALIADE